MSEEVPRPPDAAPTRGASIFSFKIMGKALLVSLVLAVIMGLAGSSIANLSLACCHQDYDCCSKSCTC